MLRAVDLLSRARRHLGLSVIHGSGWRSLTAGTWRLQSDLPDRPQHRSGVSLLPEPKQTHGAVVEQWVEKDEKLAFSHAYTGSMFTRARQFRNCCRVLTASSPARALWIDPEWSHWFRPTPAKMAPFFTGVDRITHLRRRLASECLRLGVPDLDASVLQSGLSRRITQLVSRVAYEQGYPGICYRSRYSHDLENWALFEPFRLQDATSEPVDNDRPALREALRILGLKLA